MVQARTTLRADARRNHETVLEAAIRVLAERPAASMQEIAEASGLGRTTVYRHFPTREDLVEALHERVGDEATAFVRELIDEGTDAADVLRRLGPAIVSIGERYSFLLATRAAMEGHVDKRGDEPLLPLLRAGQRKGEVRREISVEWMLVMLRGMAMAAIEEVHNGLVDAEAAGERLGATFVAAFAVEPGSR